MPELYAQSFDLQPRSDSDPAAEFSVALRSWTRPRWPSAVPWFSLDDATALKAPDGSIFRWEPFADGTRRLLEFTWRHPHAGSPAIQWFTKAVFAVMPGRIYLSLRVANTGPTIGQPGALPTSRPRLLLSIAEHFTMKTLGTAIQAEPIRLTESDFTSFVRYELFDPTRRYPVAILSPTATDAYVISPATFGREFIGIAKTYYAASAASTFALTEELGRKELSCFHGAMRVYLPGLTRESDPTRHPLMLPRRLAGFEERLRLAQALTWLTVSGFEDAVFINELRDERAVHLESKRSRLLGLLEKTRRTASESDDFRQLAEMYSQQSIGMSAEIEQLREELEEARNKIGALQYALSQRDGDSPYAESSEGLAFPPTSVADAVEQAQALFPDDLLVLPTALESAEESPYRNPQEVADTLAALARLSLQMKSGSLGQSLKDALAEGGIEYRSGIAKSTAKKLRQQYVFVDGDNEHVCEEHLCVGGGSYDPAECLRIYVNTKERPSGRIVIGHVGRHLDGRSTS